MNKWEASMATHIREVPLVFFNRNVLQYNNILAVMVVFGLIFQIGHFIEHVVQFIVWFSGKYQWVVSNFCGRDTPFMSAPATEMVRLMGEYLFPEADVARQMMMGIEILHLIGNSIFLATIVGV